MIRYLSLSLCLLLFSVSFTKAQVDLNYYLPDSITYDPNIPTPKSFLGYEIGEWHISHDQLYYYMRELAQASDRVVLEVTGRSHENRPIILLTITTPENLSRLDEIKTEHKKLSDPDQSANLDTSEMPAVLFQGYSVHGNEPSAVNAAVLAAYHFAAAQDEKTIKQLEKTIMLIDPALNPDGVHRFSTWVNMHKSKNLNPDPADREFNEAYPRARTNHYWFDLNRDWMPVQHPESRARVQSFHEWKPNVVTDFHEMGTNSTYFFQPGIPSRTHPLTPEKNQSLTEDIANYHAKYLDRIGTLYYSKESFDDFYYGKGSTFPDANGSIGILFEQASSRGHLQESVNGLLSFPATIRNQLATTLSTAEAVYQMRVELLDYQKSFYESAIRQASTDEIKAYALSEKDQSRLMHLVDILRMHEIDVYHAAKDVDGLKKEETLIVSADATETVPTHKRDV
ncbi:MAG: M14 family metallopeptidase [Cyclobacteriaceae bacterium]|nr:M14 family metallopeptidase [Cyclobacteriaceae bacterium]